MGRPEGTEMSIPRDYLHTLQIKYERIGWDWTQLMLCHQPSIPEFYFFFPIDMILVAF